MAENQSLDIEIERLEIEKSRLKIEQSIWKKYLIPLISLAGVIIAGVFAGAEVWVASIQKERELETTEIQKNQELELARLGQERQWKLDMAKFVFDNRESIFSDKNSKDQEKIVKVIAITFPPELSTILLGRMKEALPEEQKATVEKGQKIVNEIQIKDTQRKLYYVIAMTSSDRKDIDQETQRIKNKVGKRFNELFPHIEVYDPPGSLSTLLMSSKPQPYHEAQILKESAIKNGFSPETWLWQSTVEYFSHKNE